MTQERSARRLALLREAAAQVLLAEGFDAVTHRAVAARSGVPLGSTTYYFTDRDDLLRQALEHAAGLWLQGSRDALAALPRRLSSRVAVARGVLAVAVGDTDLGALYERYAQAARSAPLREVVARLDDELVALLAVVLTRGGRDASAARLVLASTDGLLLSALARGAEDPRADALPELTRLIALLPAA